MTVNAKVVLFLCHLVSNVKTLSCISVYLLKITTSNSDLVFTMTVCITSACCLPSKRATYLRTVVYFYAPILIDRGHVIFALSVRYFVCKNLTLATTFEWYMIELSYLTCVFIFVEPFLDTKVKVIWQGQISRSQFKKKMAVVAVFMFHKHNLLHCYVPLSA